MSVSLGRLQQFYGALDAEALLRVMIKEEFAGRIALLTSFGADAALLLSMVAEVDKAMPVLFLETGKHFPETLEYANDLTRHLGLADVRWLKPDAAMAARIDPNGTLWQTQPNRCCWLRKVEPLNRAVEAMGLSALITGRKRYQTQDRQEMDTIELDEKGVFRINPLAEWSKERQKTQWQQRALPEHPLVGAGYPSIGCAPCTARVEEGQDERAGRWAHTIGLDEDRKVECGIHVPDAYTNWSV